MTTLCLKDSHWPVFTNVKRNSRRVKFLSFRSFGNIGAATPSAFAPKQHSLSVSQKIWSSKQSSSIHRFVITSRQRHGYSLSRIFNMDEIPMRFELPFSRTLEFSGIITNDCVLCFFTLARLIFKYVSI